MSSVGVSPLSAAHGVDAPCILGVDQPEANQRGAGRVHELGRRRPVGGDDRLAQQHAFGGYQAEALAPVQRQHDVGCGCQRQQRGGWERVRHQSDVGAAHDCRCQARKVVRKVIRVADLQDQHAVRSGAERGPEGVNGPKRVFPHKGRGEIERGEDDHRVVGEVEVGPPKRCRSNRVTRHRWPDHGYRRIDERGQGVGREA
jgi:hypothetical protein